MITEDYCSYEVAKLLKEKGFDEEVDHVYLYFDKDDIRVTELSYPKKCQNLKSYSYPHITHQMAMKWLREVHKIMITIIPQEVNVGIDRMCYAIYRITEDLYQPLYNGKVDNLIDSYEEAVEAALKYSLENLI